MPIDCHWLGLDPPSPPPGDITMAKNYQELRISIIKNSELAPGGHPANEYKQNCYITRCRIDNWKPPNKPPFGKDSVVFYGLHFCDVKHE